jgi:hypothetical protein
MPDIPFCVGQFFDKGSKSPDLWWRQNWVQNLFQVNAGEVIQRVKCRLGMLEQRAVVHGKEKTPVHWAILW